jgi:hypothetical protein
MSSCKQPTKEQVREYMNRRISERTPLPDLQQIKRELGIVLIGAHARDGGRPDSHDNDWSAGGGVSVIFQLGDR